MKSIKKLVIILFTLLRHHPLKSIWFNIKVFPFKQAIRLPILLYSDIEFRNLSGKIVLLGPVPTFGIKIGYNRCYTITSRPKTVWDIRGKLIFKGPVSFLNGSYILVGDGGELTIGTNGTIFGSDTKILCFESITIGDNVRVSWENQFYDTSFHYVETEKGCSKLSKPIIIGNNCWIGNRSTISKGCILPDYSIIGNGSLANKDYSEHGEYCLYIGYPAVLKKVGVKRVFDRQREAELDSSYGYHRNFF